MSRQYLLSQDQPASQGQNDGTGIPMSPLRDDGVSVRGSFRSVSQRSSMTDHGPAVIGTAEAHNLGPSIWAPTSMPRPSRGAFIKRKPVASARSEEQTPLDPETAAHDEPVKVSQTTAQGRAIKAFHWWWWWEIAAAVLSITSMCLIIAVLFRVQDTKLADWPWEIQPSFVISILTTISKTAMMVPIASCISQLKWRHMQLRPRPLNHLQVFDDASRGPWGSAIMAWKLPFQSFLGWALALVTIVALGIEPSAQNILDFPSRDWNVTDEDGFMAEMGKADNYFSKGFLQLPGNNFQLWVPNSDLPNFQAAILNGLSGAVFEPNHKCPGNSTRCLWPDFKSLGVCSSFHNVTEETTRNCTVKNKNDWIQNCTCTIPGRMSTDPPTLEYYNNGPTSLKDTQVYYSDYGYSQRLGQLTVVRHDSGDWPESKTPPSPEIFLADFDWCVKSYSNVSATPGTLSVGQSTSELLEFREVRGMFDRKESPLNAESVRLATADNSTEAEITQMVREWLPRYLQNLLQGELFEQVPGRRPDKTPKPDTAMNLEFLLYNAKDLKAVTKNLADTITNQIRSGSPGDNSNATMVRGEVWRTETSITVRWPWLILPAMETVITAILLVVSILMTMKSPLLKTSTTAFLAYPLSGWGADELAIQDPQSAEKLNKLAQGLEGQFEKDNGNWRFVRS